MKTTLLPIVFSLVLSAGAFGQTYKIQLQRAEKVGEKYNITTTATQSNASTASADGKVLQENKEAVTYDLKGTEQVLAVDTIGRETKVSITLDKLTKTANGTTTDVLPKGTVVVSSVAGKKEDHTVNDKPVDPEIAQALNAVVLLSKGDPDDDQIFGTKEPKKVGDTWDANAPLMMSSLDELKGQIANLSGKTTLAEVVKGPGGDVLKIKANVTGDFHPPLPPQASITSSSLQISFAGDFPANVEQGRPHDTMDMTCSLAAQIDAPNGQKVTMQVKIAASVVHTQTKVSP